MLTMYIFSLLKERVQNKIKFISLNMIVPNEHKFRDIDKDSDMQELIQSVKDYGILQPILVNKLENDMFKIISGHRRYFAAKKANLLKMPVVDIDVCNKKVPIVYLSENLHRKNLHFFEEAEIIFKLINDYKLSQDMISTSLGVEQSFITDRLNLLRLGENIKKKITINNIKIEYALMIARLNNERDQLSIAEKIIKDKLTIDQTKFLIEKYNKNKFIFNYSDNQLEEARYVINNKLFDSTISEAIEIIGQSGVKASSVKNECSEYVEYIIKIPKNKLSMKKSVGF